MSAADAARRLVDDVQRLGLSSASTLVDRYAVAVEQALGLGPPARGTEPPDPATLIEVTARMARAYLGLLDGLEGLADRGLPGGDLEAVRMSDAHAGTSSQATVWVHNHTGETVEGGVRLAPFVSAEGIQLPLAASAVEPASTVVPAGSRAEIRVRVDVPDGQPPGTYFGLALWPGSVRPVALHLAVVEGAAP